MHDNGAVTSVILIKYEVVVEEISVNMRVRVV